MALGLSTKIFMVDCPALNARKAGKESVASTDIQTGAYVATSVVPQHWSAIVTSICKACADNVLAVTGEPDSSEPV